MSYLDKCADSISESKVVDVIYFDFAKAFDTVPHRRLIKKLNAYGIRGLTLDWIKSFLSDRHQYVKVNDKLSKEGKVLSGVPQGSVLGPLLFVMYINDLPEVTNSDMYLFADDTKLVEEINSAEDAIRLQLDIDAMERWSKDWLLRFHPDKCHVLTLGKFWNIKHAHPYNIGGVILEHVEQEKDLGVIIDGELNFDVTSLVKSREPTQSLVLSAEVLTFFPQRCSAPFSQRSSDIISSMLNPFGLHGSSNTWMPSRVFNEEPRGWSMGTRTNLTNTVSIRLTYQH